MKVIQHWRSAVPPLMAAALVFSTCTFKTPQAPVWNVWLSVPLISKTYTMEDLADETDFLEIENNTVVFTFDQEIDPFEVGDNLSLSGAAANFPVNVPDPSPQGSQHTSTGSVTMAADIVVSQSRIKSGGMTISAANTSNYSLTASLTIPSLNNGSQPYVVTVPVLPGASLSNHFNLAGMNFNPGSQNVGYTAVLTVEQQGTYGGNVNFTIEIENLVFSSLTGTLDHLAVDVPASVSDLDIPEEFSNILLGAASVDLALRANFDISQIVVDLNVTGYDLKDNPSGTVTVPVQGTLTDNTAGDGRFNRTLHVPGLQQLINAMPGRIEFGGSVELGNGGSVTLSDTSTFRTTAVFKAPMTLSIPADSTQMDPADLDIGQDTKDILAKNLETFEMHATIENHLPFGVGVAFYFSDDTLTLYDLPLLKIGPLTVTSGTIAGGIVTGAVTSDLTVSLTEADLDVFQEETLYQGMKLIFPGTGGMVTARPEDYIAVQAYLRSRVRVDFSDDNGNQGERP